MVETRRLLLRGRVQGVGFRPFAHRLATELGLTGMVRNTTGGAEVVIQGPGATVDRFARRLCDELPPGGQIDGVIVEHALPIAGTGFSIELSAEIGSRHARAPADRAICVDCRREINDPADRRSGYPFTACTACGPRYSVIEALPYDRPATSLRNFPLCNGCQTEYAAPADRRFHAQATVCPACGPQLSCWPASGAESPLRAARDSLTRGRVIALKGLGGYQLLVRADDPAAVARLRERKRRPTKPLAIMVRNTAEAETLAHLSAADRAALESAENPIVLVQRRAAATLAAAVAPGVSTVGLFLPTTPLHDLLLSGLGFPVVATSGNCSEEPPAISSAAAHTRLAGIADTFLDHDRPIVRRLDDSVVRIIDHRPVVFRLGRGYAPLPLPALERFNSQPMLATGGHLKNAIAIHTGSQALLSQHLGELDDPQSRSGFVSAAGDLQSLFGCRAMALAADLHPDYFTTQWAEQQRLPLTRVQHHHAHAAAVQAEHGLLGTEVTAVTWDGTGFGFDETFWGGEFLTTSPSGDFRRLASLRPIALVGSAAAIRHPARIAFAMLLDLQGADAVSDSHWLARLAITQKEAVAWAAMIDRGLNVTWSSGIGRLFDGLAALILGVGRVSYEAEAAIYLESVADEGEENFYPIPTALPDGSCRGDKSIPRGDWRPLLAAVLTDLTADLAPGRIAARVHNSLARWAAEVVGQFPSRPVVLGGGCFQNRLLAERTLTMINAPTFFPSSIPPGDGGLAAGQLAVALQRDGES